MDSLVTVSQGLTAGDLPAEVVERKGIGHPDTLADALAERMSVAYSRMCLDLFGAVLHHNLDKVYLRGGHARTDLGEHEMTEPAVLVIGGRVSTSFAGRVIAHQTLFEQVARDYLATVLPSFDAARWLRIEHSTTDRSRYPAWFHPGSLEDLPEIASLTSSDTVAVTAWAPYSPTESLVLALERYLNQEGAGPRYPHLGQDIKLMACRRGSHVDVIANVAVHPGHATTADAYDEAIADLLSELEQVAATTCPDLGVSISVNTQAVNPFGAKRHYLLGSGSCLEFGEEGFVGRGNGPSGLIAVQRPKSVEAVYGKNPVYHAGKVYTIYGDQIARQIHDQLDVAATVAIVAAHSRPLRRPSFVMIDTSRPADPEIINDIVTEILDTTDHLSQAVYGGCLIPR